MTDSKVEQVARAIRKRYCQRYGLMSADVDDWDDLGGKQDDWREVARAAIEAMREPTAFMRNTGFKAIRDMGNVSAAYKVNPCWESMIDAALQESDEKDSAA